MNQSKLALSIRRMVKPSSPAEFREAGYGQFEVTWNNGASRGKLFGKLDTCSPSYTIQGRFRMEKNNTLKCIAGEKYTYTKKKPGIITMEDIEHFIRELGLHLSSSERTEDLKDQLMQTDTMSIEQFKELPIYKELSMDSHCELFRSEYEVPLRLAFENQPGIQKLSGEQLEQVCAMLKKEPWKLWFHANCKPFGLKEMTYKGFNNYRMEYKYYIHAMFHTALRMYSFLKEQREKGNEVFCRAQIVTDYLRDDKWGPKAEEYGDKQHCEEALNFLYYKGLQEAFPGYLAFPRDVFPNQTIMHALSMMRGQPALRQNGQVPCLPSASLTDVQRKVIQHVHTNKLTLLQGAPGTGKTEVLVGIMAHFKAPLVVTYVGMMVDALQNRFGKRTETANTIHYVCHMAENLSSEEWLSKFDLLVIDEGSNVDARLFYRLLRHTAAHVCRLVIVGDLGQILPIKPGCPFKDLLTAFPQHAFELTENKRVDPDARELARASAIIRGGQERVDFSISPALQLIESHDPNKLEHVLESMVHSLQDTMDMQIVTLRNQDRKFLNTLVEELLLKRGILQKKRVSFIGGVAYYAGKKIIFTKNTKSVNYDGVRNGEIGQIETVRQLQNGTHVVHLTNGKKVLISQSSGVNPFHIQPGYATTCNKSQGSEWKHIIFWMYENPQSFFTREYPYVAVSRAKKQCIVFAAKEEDFHRVCSRQALPRHTLLRHYLADLPIPAEPFEHIELLRREELTLLPADVAAVPTPPTATTKTDKRSKIGNI